MLSLPRGLFFKLPALLCAFGEFVSFTAAQTLTIFGLSLMLLSTAHADDIAQRKLSDSEKARIFALQNPFGERYLRFAVQGQEQPVLLGLRSCQLYRARLERGIVTEWMEDSALNTFYPWWSSCSQESLRQEGQYIRVSFCKTPLGAGGGCAGGGGAFRSTNGIDWQKLEVSDKWKSFVNKK
jgi:hypothetical protein